MEQFYTYRNYGISYNSLSGKTTVADCGIVLVSFNGFGMAIGDEKAKKYIDEIEGDSKIDKYFKNIGDEALKKDMEESGYDFYKDVEPLITEEDAMSISKNKGKQI